MVAGGFECDLRPIAELDEGELRRVAREISQRQPPVRNVVVCGVFSPHESPRQQEPGAASSGCNNVGVPRYNLHTFSQGLC